MRTVVGIEIGKKTIKMIRVDFKRNMLSYVDQCDFLALEDKYDQLKLKLKEMTSGASKNISITLFVPRNQVTVRNIHLPSENPEEIKRMLDLHIGRIVPYKKEDVVYNYMSCGQDKSGYMRVMLAIAHNDMIKEQLRLIDEVGIFVDNIALSTCGVYQSIKDNNITHSDPEELYAIVDIDDAYADFIVANKDRLLFTRTLQLIKDIESDEELDKFIGEVRQSLAIFNNEEVNKRPSKIYLSGKRVDKMDHRLEEEMGIEVVSLDNPAELVSGLSVSALRSSRFVPGILFQLPELEFKKSIKEKIKELALLSFLVVYCIGMITMLVGMRLSSMDEYMGRLKKGSLEIETKYSRIIENYEKIHVVDDILNNRNRYLWILLELQSIIAEETVLNYISVEKSNITIRGRAKSSSDVFSFVNLINKNLQFSQAQASYTRQRETGDTEYSEFEITFKQDR